MKPKLDSHGLDRNPHNITPRFWYYEGTGGLDCYSQDFLGTSARLGTITWRSIRASLKRYDAAKARKAVK